MTDNKITREMTFSEELPNFKERIKKVFDNYNNPNGNEDPLYICVLRDSNRIVRKAEEEITHQQEEIERLKGSTIVNNIMESQRIKREAKAKAYKECIEKVKNYIKTHCNPYGKPDFDYDTSIKILNFIDNLKKELVGEDNV